MDITELIELLCEKFGIAFDSASKTLTPYIKQIMVEVQTGQVALAKLGLLFGVLSIIIAIVLFVLEDKVDLDGFGGGFGTIFSLIGVTLIVMGSVKLVRWATMPTYMTINYIKQLIS